MVVSPQPRRASPAPVPSIEVLSPWGTSGPGTVWPGTLAEVTGGQVWSPASDHCDQTPLLNVSSPSSDADGECHVSNITVVTDTTEADNVTSISIEHETGTFYNQEHDNKALIVHDNVSYISLENLKHEPVKIKISASQEEPTDGQV